MRSKTKHLLRLGVSLPTQLMAYSDSEQYSYSRSLTSMVLNQMHEADILYQLETREDLLSSLFSLTVSKSSPTITQKKVVVNEQVESQLISMLSHQEDESTPSYKTVSQSQALNRMANVIEFLGIAAGLWFMVSQVAEKYAPKEDNSEPLPTETSLAAEPIIVRSPRSPAAAHAESDLEAEEQNAYIASER